MRWVPEAARGPVAPSPAAHARPEQCEATIQRQSVALPEREQDAAEVGE